jgi:hypothetical protein
MKPRRNPDWAEAARRCRLSAEVVEMAMALGMSPRDLLKNIPSASQRWKAPVADWVRRLYFKRFKDRPAFGDRPTPEAASHPGAASVRDAETSAAPDSRFDPEPPAEPDPDRPMPRNLLREAEDALLQTGVGPVTDGEDFFLRMAAIERDTPVSEGEIEEANRLQLNRRRAFRGVAESIARTLRDLPFVRKVVLFGSVAAPPIKEVPRFRRLRQAGIEIYHECQDVDLAVWVTDLRQLATLRKLVAHVTGAWGREFPDLGGVAHHQVDVFLFEPGTNRYRGNLCHFATCPKDKPECAVAGCGAQPFLRLYEDFPFNRLAPLTPPAIVLFDRAGEASPGRASDAAELEVPF